MVCLLTQVEVDPADPAFDAPSKPVGYFYGEAEAEEIRSALGWTMHEDAGRGWRLVVPSPEPRHIADISLVQAVIESGAVAIAGGGGGIPVLRAPDGTRRGLAAVIDKDLSSALMATVLGLDALFILTAVPRVCIHFGTAREKPLGHVTAAELRAWQREGHFAAGSMGPKVEAAVRVRRADRKARGHRPPRRGGGRGPRRCGHPGPSGPRVNAAVCAFEIRRVTEIGGVPFLSVQCLLERTTSWERGLPARGRSEAHRGTRGQGCPRSRKCPALT